MIRNILLPPPALPENLSLLSEIGHGGAGQLYRVQDITGKQLALKVIRSNWLDAELNAICALRELPAHPALVQVFQTGKLISGEFYYTMELADNISDQDSLYRPDTLARRIADTDIPAIKLLELFTILAGGVQHLHDADIFHGDIKPENIIFVNGQPKIADFGTLGANQAGTAGFIPENPVSGIDRDCYALCKTFYCSWSKLDAADYPNTPEKFNQKEYHIIRKVYSPGCAPHRNRRFASANAVITALNKAQKQLAAPCRNWAWYTLAILLTSIMTAGIVMMYPTGTLSTASGRPDIDQKELKIAESAVHVSGDFNGDFNNIRDDFRQIFESVNRDYPEKIDPEFRKYIADFYRDSDAFIKLRKRITAPGLSRNDFLHLYNTEKYLARFSDLTKRACELPNHHRHIQQLLRLYHSRTTSTK